MTEENRGARGFDPDRPGRSARFLGWPAIWSLVFVAVSAAIGAGGVLGFQYLKNRGWSLPALSVPAVTVSPGPKTSGGSPPEIPKPEPAPVAPVAPVVEPVEAAPPAASAPIGETRPARLLSRVEPEYPALARQARMSGTVKLYCTIGLDGQVALVEIDEGNPILADAAMKAVRQWRYEPALLRGAPTFSKLSVTVNFDLGR